MPKVANVALIQLSKCTPSTTISSKNIAFIPNCSFQTWLVLHLCSITYICDPIWPFTTLNDLYLFLIFWNPHICIWFVISFNLIPNMTCLYNELDKFLIVTKILGKGGVAYDFNNKNVPMLQRWHPWDSQSTHPQLPFSAK